MNYYVREVQTEDLVQRTAGVKARDDVEAILAGAGWLPILVEDKQSERAQLGRAERALLHVTVKKEWDRKLENLSAGDHLLIQFPVFDHTILMGSVVRKLQKRGVRVTLLIHDLETLRAAVRGDRSTAGKIRLHLEEVSILRTADHVIAHNSRMKKYLVRLGVKADRVVSLMIFDYLIPEFSPSDSHPEYGGPVIIAGALREHKAGYAYHLPQNCAFNLYGVGYTAPEQEHVHYFGSFPPDELPAAMHGSFGLVWDGDTTKTCGGTFGQYLKINDPHKTSLYLASGIPVIIWDQAALATFITRKKCGITVSSVDEIGDRLRSVTPQMYEEMAARASEIGRKLRAGHYTLRAVRKCGETS